jgi:hypothetical protein
MQAANDLGPVMFADTLKGPPITTIHERKMVAI